MPLDMAPRTYKSLIDSGRYTFPLYLFFKDCDAVTIARPLLANPDLPNQIRRAVDENRYDVPAKPCTLCNRC